MTKIPHIKGFLCFVLWGYGVGTGVQSTNFEMLRREKPILDKADTIRRKRQQALTLADWFLWSTFLEMFGAPVANPKGWEVKQLQELIDLERPITYGILKPGPDVDGGVPYYIRVVDMANGEVLTSQVRKTTSKIAAEYKRSTLREGDLLMSIRGHVGRLAITPESLAGANITQDTTMLAPVGVSAT